MATPDFTQQFDEIWGWPNEIGGACFPIISAASNVIVGSNPPYSYTDFIATYPQFAGTPKAIAGSLISGSTNLTAVTPDISSIAAGQYITGDGLASGTTVVSVSGTTIVLSQPAIANALPGTWNVYTAPTIPTVIVNAYIYLAVNSLYIDRWGAAMWPLTIGLFVAHYVTMWALAQTPAGATVAQIASAGLAIGLDIGQHAGDVSYSTKPLEFAGFGTWQLTIFGQQLATFAQVIGSGGMLLW